MIREICSIAVASTLLASAGAGWARSDKTEELMRTEKWEVNYDSASCHLIGRFGEGDDQVSARFTWYQPGDGFDLILYGSRFRSWGSRVEAKIDFGSAALIESRGMIGKSGDLNLIAFSSLRLDGWRPETFGAVAPDVTPAREAATTGVTVAISGKHALHLEFGSLGKPMKMMRDCTTRLVERWGYDPAVQAALTRPATPIGAPQTWVRNSDYPNEAMRRGANGIVQFRLDVDPQGKVAGCSILARTNPDEFADITCSAMKSRAAFRPALDAQSKPVRSYFVSKVVWETN